MRSFSWEVRAREAQTLQAGLPPNPEISFELEDFGGTGSVEGFEGTETTILLSQLIPLGGKLSKRKKVASLNTKLAGWDYETVRLNVLTQTTINYLNVLAAQDQLALELELVSLAEKVHTTVSELARAGEISPIQISDNNSEKKVISSNDLMSEIDIYAFAAYILSSLRSQENASHRLIIQDVPTSITFLDSLQSTVLTC